MDASELAKLMLEWERLTRKAEFVEIQIQEAVLEIGSTQKVGNVHASFSKGRGKYDYQGAYESNGELASEDLLDRCTTKVTDWKKVCEAMGIDMESHYVQTSGPSVSVKLVKPKQE